MKTNDPCRDRFVCIYRYEGIHEDRFQVVLVECDGQWEPRSAHLDDRSQAVDQAELLARHLGLRLEPIPMRAGTWAVGATS